MSKAILLAAIGVGAYLTRDSWLPVVQAAIPTGTGATGINPAAPIITAATQPVTAATPGAVPIGTDGCFAYPTGTDGSMVINCPPGVSPPPTSAPANHCASGFTLDAGGICTRYPDSLLLANLNTIPWTGTQDIPVEQINRIDPQILAMYSTTTGINAGTVLAYMLGLGASPADGTMRNGSDGFTYQALGGVFYRQGTATWTTTNPGAGSTLQGLGTVRTAPLSAALPITRAVLIEASSNPGIAAIVGRDQRAMLTASQWNAYYTQATGIVQGIPLHPDDMQGAVMSAEQYQARRAAAGLMTTSNLGTLRPARRGAFPLGGLGLLTQWTPPGNRTIFRIPGRGAVPAGANGMIPAAGRSRSALGMIQEGGGNHRWARSPFPRPSWWREAE